MINIYKVDTIERKNYKKYLFTEEQKKLICDLYEEYGSTVKVGEKFGVGHKVIAKVLKEFGIARTAASKRKYALNEHYFDEIDTPNKAYIFGFLMADGCNNKSKSTISMSLEEKDKEILDKIRMEIGSERPLEFIDYTNKHDFGYTYKNQYRLLMFSIHMCEVLEQYGMIPNKSLIAEFPVLPASLVKHFIRGLFDGDGSVYRSKYKKTRNSYQHTLTITSTFSMCEKLVEIVEREVKINCHIYDASNRNGITKVFTISGKNQIKKFMDWMYQDADLFLQRKYNRYLEYFYEEDNNINNSSVA